MDFQDRNNSNDTSDGTASEAAPAESTGRMMRTVVLQPDANNVVTLPQGVSLDTIVADGRDLVIQADGVIYVIPDGAIVVPQLVVGGITVPALNLASLLIGNEPVPAAGPQLNSSGGNFELTPGDIQAAYDLGDLLPYTELAFPQPQDEEIIPQPVDRPPTVIVITPDNPAGAVDAIALVDEAGLPARGSEPAGTEQETNAETTTGTISYTAPDGTGSVLINGVEITAVGQAFVSPDGTLTITSIAEGAIGFSYTLGDNLLGVTEDGFFTVTVIDTDGDTASASLLINVLDDAPIARNDTDTVAAGTYGPESGNVITAAGTTSGPAGADNVGADGATLTGISNSAGVSAAVASPVVIAGAYGTLTIAPDGSYIYVRAEGTPGGVNDTFTYTLTDGDGSTATAVLTINIGDSPATVISVPAIGDPGTVVDEAGLPPRTDGAPGTAEPTPVETTTGTITFSAPDGPATVTINGEIITGPGQIITVPQGTLTIVTYDPETGTIDYTFTLGDNTAGDETTVTFDVTVTDVDGDSDSGSFTITILDDAPLAVDDSAAQIGENTPVTVDVFANDIEGADSVQLDAIAAVDGALSGTGAVVYNGDGTFTYTPGPGEEGTVTFDYSITDGDGDVSTATVTIILNDDSTPTISAAGDNSVDEAGLPVRDGEPAGSDSVSDSEIATGILNITTGGDTVGSLVINGVDVTNGGTVTTAKGALVITLDAGQYSYSYTLADNTLADPDSDSFSLTVTDSDGDQAATTLVISIADDIPTANDDNAGQIAENQAITIDALANDVFGADDVDASDIADVFVATQPAQGVVTYDPATGLFTYTPNAGAGSTSTTDSFTYTIVDGDGDSSTATVNVTLQPDSVPVVVNVTALVDDDALAGGNPASTAQDIDANAGDDPLTASEAVYSGKITVDFGSDTGTVSFANLDGTSGTVGTETVNYTWNTGSNTLTATGPRGVLFTVAMDAAGNYVLTQLDNVLHTAGNDEASADDVVLAYRASDSDGDTDDTGTLTITFNDDAPTATADTNSLAEGGTATGNVLTDGADDAFGADGPATTSPTGGVIGFAAGSDTSVAAAGTPGSTIESALGFLTLNGDGSYSYASKPNSTNADTTDTFVYTIQDGDGDISTQTLTISIDNVAGQVSDNDVLVDEAGLDTNGSQGGSDSEIDADGQITVTGTTGTLSYTLLDPADGTFGTLVLDSATGAYTYTLDTPVTDNTGDDGRNTVSGAVNGAEEFDYQVTDSVGNVIGTGTIVINIIDDVPSVVADDLFGGSLSVDESNLLVDATGVDFTGAFTVAMGADAPGSTAYSLTLSAEGADSGLNDTASGADILLYTNGNTVEGRVGGSGGAVAFVITNTDGVLSLDQRSAVEHPDAANPDDVVDIDDGRIFLTATASDEDNDTASDSLDIGAALNFADDAPSANTATVSVRVEEDELAGGITDGDAFNTVATGSLASLVDFGADGAGSFGFALAGFTDPAITSGGAAVKWGVSADGLTLVGYTGATIADGQVITVAITDAATGSFTVTLLDQVDHLPNTPANDDSQTLSLALGSAVVATDGDGDPVTLGGTAALTVVIEDDVPSVVADDLFGGSLSVDESNLLVDATGVDFTGAFTVAMGADAPGSTAYSLTLSAEGADSGLNDTASGADILLYTNGNTVEGRVGGSGGAVAFVITNTDGVLSLDQRSAVEHPDAANPDDVVDIDDGRIFLTATASDEDNDTASDSLDIGAALNFADDAPSANTATVSVRVEEDELAGGITDGDAFNTVATGSLASLVDFGADGAGSFGFALAGFTDPAITSGGAAVKWGVSADGLTLVGYTGATIADGQVITVAITDAATGSFTVTLLDQVDHLPNTPANDDSQTLSLALGSAVVATDGDGDPVTLGGTAALTVVIEDDVPSVVADDLFGGSLSVDESNLLVDATGVDFTGAFTVAMGADAPGSTAYSLTLSAEGADSGLNDTASGADILLYTNGNTVEGRVGGSGGAVAFVITNTDGVLSLDQRSAVEHPDAANPDDVVDIDDGRIFLTATASDEDNDTASDSLDIGAALNFADDAPSANTATVSVRVEEDELAGGITDGDAFNTVATGSLASLVDFGADGAGSFGFALAGFTDPAITSGGAAVKWGVSADGLTLVGYTGATIADGQVITVAITDAATGSFTVTLLDQVDHLPNTPANDDSQTLSLALGSAVVATDGDGDPVTLGGTAALTVVIEDDVPSVVADDLFGGSLSVDESNLLVDATGVDFTGAFTVAMGADAPGSTAYSLTLSAEGADSGLNDTASGADILLYTNGNTVEGRVGGSGGAVAFVITNTDGVLSLDQRSAVEHPDAANPDDVVDIDDGRIFLTATASDEDNDTASDSLDIGAALNFADDAPSANTATVSVRVEEDELAGGITDGDAFNTVATGSLASLVDFGADGAGSFGFALAGFTDPAITSGGAAVKWGVSADGLTLVGYTGATIADGQVITVAITDAATGSFTVTLLDQVDHLPNTPANDDSQTLSLALGSAVVATDGDGDPVTLGGTAALTVVIEDDVPSVVADDLFGGSLSVDESNLLVDATGVDFTGAFTVAMGADAPGSTAYSLTLSAEGADSGLNDTASGADILLYTNGNTVEGRVGGSGGAVAFVITNTDGVLSLDQRSAVEHPDAANPDDVVDIDDGRIFLTATASDEDNDTASDSLDIGAALNFADDAPSANTATVSVRVEEDELAGGITDGDAFNTVATGSLASLVDFGADGAGSFGFALAGFTDPAITSGGAAVKWGVSADGLTLVGYTGATIADGQVITVAITDAATGSFTVTLLDQVDHLPNTPANDDSQTLSLALGSAVVATDGDGDPVTLGGTAALTVVIEDDIPVAVAPLSTSLLNVSGASSTKALDTDGNVANNYGADGPGKVYFNESLEATPTGLTVNFAPVKYDISADGQKLTAYTGNDPTNASSTIFTVDIISNDYKVTMFAKLDSTQEIDFNNGGYNFTGGNKSWNGFVPNGEALGGIQIDNNSQDLLLTPIISGANGGTVNTTATIGGISGGASVSSGEAFRVDFVTDLRGDNADTVGGQNYAAADNRDHVFDGHYTVNGATALFKSSSGSVVKFTAFDDPDSNTIVGDGIIDTITGITLSFKGVAFGSVIIPTSTPTNYSITAGGTTQIFTVTLNADGKTVNVGGVAGDSGSSLLGTVIGVFTDNGFNSVEYSWVSGDTFQIGDFGATTLKNDPVSFAIPVEIVDGDGDAVPSGLINITANPANAPIALDLNHDGQISFLGLDAGVTHSYEGGAAAVQTAWVAPEDGLLARQTGDNSVDIYFADDAVGAKTDLEGLRLAFDSNGDGILDSADSTFYSFGVWQDANSNGLVDAGEFRSLTDAGITSINLMSDGIAYSAANGDVLVHGTGSYARADGTTGQLADASFAVKAIAEMNQRGSQVAAVNAALAALVMPEMLVAMDQATSSKSSEGLDLSTENLVSGSGQSTMAMADQMAMAGDDLFQSSNAAPGPNTSQSIGYADFENVALGEFDEPVAFDHANLVLPVSNGPVFSFGSGSGASEFAAPSVEGMHLMDALLTLGQDVAIEVLSSAAEGGTGLNLDASALKEAMADINDNHAVDAIVDHFSGDLALGAAEPVSHFDTGILDVGIADAQATFGMPSMAELTADDMSALAASA